jgi:hypothetical protein
MVNMYEIYLVGGGLVDNDYRLAKSGYPAVQAGGGGLDNDYKRFAPHPHFLQSFGQGLHKLTRALVGDWVGKHFKVN